MFPDTKTTSLSDSLVADIQRLDDEARSELFLSYIKTAGEVWFLKNDDGFFMMEQGEHLVLPVWPHTDLASAWNAEGLNDAQPVSVPVKEFTDTWLPGLAANQTSLLVLPVTGQPSSLVVDANDLAGLLGE